MALFTSDELAPWEGVTTYSARAVWTEQVATGLGLMSSSQSLLSLSFRPPMTIMAHRSFSTLEGPETLKTKGDVINHNLRILLADAYRSVSAETSRDSDAWCVQDTQLSLRIHSAYDISLTLTVYLYHVELAG